MSQGRSVLFAGELTPGSRSHQRAGALEQLGHTVVGVPLRPLDAGVPGARRSFVVDSLFGRLGRPRDTSNANASLDLELGSRPFDVLWIDKGLTIRPRTLRQAKTAQPGMQLVFHSEDDMYLRHNQSAYFLACLPLYDIVFTTKRRNLRPEELPSLGARRVTYEQPTFDPTLHRPVAVGPDTRLAFGGPIGFIGTHEIDRAASLLHLARSGFPVRVWGNGWGSMSSRHPNLHIEGRPAWGEDLVRAICSTDINLGFLRKQNRDEHTSRSVEIPACGGFLLAERTSEHLALFREGKEAEFFKGNDELVEKVSHYLEHPDERLSVAEAGRERCGADRYSNRAALERMMALICDIQ